MSVRDVLVVGAGLAGLACALACARAGARVQVLELSPAGGQAAIAAHVDLVPNLLRALDGLGVARDCVGRGFAYNRVAVVDEHGRVGFELPFQRLAGVHLPPAAGVQLEDLLSVLRSATDGAGVVVRPGCAVRSVDADAGRVETEGGASFGADLVVLATGAESALVDGLFESERHVEWPHDWWYAMVPRPAGLDQPTLVAGLPGRRLFIVPTGMCRAGVVVLHSGSSDGPVDGAAMKRTLLAWGPLPKRVAASMTQDTPTVRYRASGRPLAGAWHRRTVLCVGAAAHPLSPLFGQGDAQSVEDAVVLGELLAAGLARDELLDRFMARRAGRILRAHALAARATRWISQPEPATDLLALAGEFADFAARPA